MYEMSVVALLMLIRALERAKGPGELNIPILKRAVVMMGRGVSEETRVHHGDTVEVQRGKRETAEHLSFHTDINGNLDENPIESFIRELESGGFIETYYSEDRVGSRVMRYSLHGEEEIFRRIEEGVSAFSTAESLRYLRILEKLAKQGASFYKATLNQEFFES